MGRLLSVLATALALAACSRSDDMALLDSRPPPALAPRFFQPEGFAWGLLPEGDGAARRYGVVSPRVSPRAHVVIVAGWGESVEIYYETARDLAAAGFTTWVLDPPRRPGAGPRSVTRLLRFVIRPQPQRAVVVLGHGGGALEVMAALEAGAPADGVILTDPALTDALGPQALKRAAMGLGLLPADGEAAWRRPDYALGGRATLMEAWRTANPDLRPRPRNWAWFAERAAMADATIDAGRLKTVRAPVRLLGRRDGSGATLCAALPDCAAEPLPASQAAPYLAADAVRAVWMRRVAAFVQQRIDARTPQAERL